MSFPIIETARLRLQPFTKEDTDNLHQMWIDPAMRKYLWDDLVIPYETAVEVVQASFDSFAQHGFGYWTITFKGQVDLIGFCGLRHFHQTETRGKEVEVMYGIRYEHCGNGLATEAAQAMLWFGFERVGLEQIYAGADPPNQRSFRVMERVGMAFSHHSNNGEAEAIYYKIHCHQFRAFRANFCVLDSEAG
ncbi:MAG: GNAT family N-acetyltransferase [Acidobacteria bacterium]|nr:GNAT family N-acetyltransferase [Acidobacteriota bacterium]